MDFQLDIFEALLEQQEVKEKVAGSKIIEELDYYPTTQNLTILSYGGGQDSTTLLLLYLYDEEFRQKYAPGDFMVIMSDTGNEHPYTYEYVSSIMQLCAEKGIKFFFITANKGYHSGNWQSLKHFYKATDTCGSKVFHKTCTVNLKITPFYAFLQAYLKDEYSLSEIGFKTFHEYASLYGKIDVLIGIAKGEESRMKKPSEREYEPKWRRMATNIIYPLVSLGLDRQGCQDKIRELGHEVPMPSNCMICPYMSEIELLWLYRFYPGEYAEWVQFEKAKIAKFSHKESNYGVWKGKLLPEKVLDAQKKYGHMTDEQLNEYKFSHGHCVKSKY